MKKDFIKQIIIGIAGMLVSAGIFALVIGVLNPNSKWLSYTTMVVTVSALFIFLLYIFGGKESFIFGAKLGFGFVAFTVSVHELPQPYSGILIVVLVVIFLAWPKIKAYFSEKKETSEKSNPLFSVSLEKTLSGNDRSILPKLKQICLVLNVLAIIASTVFLFIDFNYKLMSIICLLIPIIILVLYFEYNNILSFEDEKAGKTYSRNKIRMELPLIFPSLALGLRSLLDFNFIEYGIFIFWSVFVFVIVLLAFFLFTTEYKTKKSAILAIVISMLFYAPSAIAQVNYLLDFSKPMVSSSQVIDKHIETGSKGPDRYMLTVILKNGKRCDLKVSKTYYDEVETGRVVQISEKTGFFKIKYLDVVEV